MGCRDMPKKRGVSVKLMLQTDLCGRKVRGCRHKFQVCGLIVVVGKSFRSHITNCGRKLGSAADKSYGILVNALFMGLRFQHEMNSSSWWPQTPFALPPVKLQPSYYSWKLPPLASPMFSGPLFSMDGWTWRDRPNEFRKLWILHLQTWEKSMWINSGFRLD